jgi:hypothetical protein
MNVAGDSQPPNASYRHVQQDQQGATRAGGSRNSMASRSEPGKHQRRQSRIGTAGWTAPRFLEAVTSGKVGARDFKEAASR